MEEELHTSTVTSKAALYAGSSMHGSNVLAAVAWTASTVDWVSVTWFSMSSTETPDFLRLEKWSRQLRRVQSWLLQSVVHTVLIL